MADGEAQFNPSNNNYRMLSEGLVENGQQSGNQEGPSRPLQQQRQVFQARVSGQSITSMVDRADEELDPGRTSMVDMRPRGKKKPFKSEGPVRGVLNLQLPIESSCNSQSSLLFDENKMVSYPATEPALEPRIAPHSSRAKENKVMPEQWANVKMAQNSWCSGSSGEVPHNRPSFQPSMEVDLNPCVVPCKIKPEVNTVLYDHLPAAREEYGPGDEMPRTKEQSMYLKHLLLEGSMEFCFEEVRANCYFARRLQELEEKMQKRSKAKESVLQQIEEKMRLLQQRQQQLAVPGVEQMTGGESDSTTPASQQNSMVFKIFDEESQPTPTLTSGKAMPRQSDTIQDDVFLPPGERGLCFKTPNPFQSGKIPHREQTLSKNFAEKRESLSVDVVNGHQNNTLCASPEDTLDFAKAAKIASTPSSCASGLKVVSPDTGTRTETSGVTTEPETISQQIRDLSPIQEASVERSCSQASGLTSTSSQGSVSGGQANPQLSSRKQNHSASSPDANDQNPVCTVLEDPCSQSLRQRLLDQLDLRSFPNFHSEDGYLPTVKEDDLLVLGKETFFTFSKMDFKSFSIFEGLGDGYIAIKVERCAVPWDFYIRSRLRERLARDSQAPVHDAGRCYQFRDGCITIHKAFPQETLSSQVAEGSFEKVVMAMAIQTVELVRRMHSCSLIHGALRADTLVMNCPYDEELDQAVVALDFSCSLDLEMQPEVTAARSLTSAQGFITQGLLSPTASPYQVDLLGVAETVHCLLKRVRWPVNDKSKWTLQKYQEAESSDPNGMFWSKFFRTLLCPGDRSSVSVLTELLEDMKKSDLAC